MQNQSATFQSRLCTDAETEAFRLRLERFQAQLRANPGAFLGCPGFMKAHLWRAKHGGAQGYSEAGFHLGYHVLSLEPYDTELEEWHAIVERELSPLVAEENNAAAIEWLVRRYPRIMSSVPKRRRENFVTGFYAGFAKGGAV